MKFSVALITYNGSRFIEQQLHSILAQAALPHEIVMRDDASTDNTVEIARTVLARANFLVDIRVNPSQQGVVKNLQGALEACSGDVVVLCDQDDVWMPDRLQVLQEAFGSPDVAGACSDAAIIDGQGSLTGARLWPRIDVVKDWSDEFGILRHLMHGSIITGATLAVRQSIVRAALPFPAGCYHDHWLALLAAGAGRLDTNPTPLIQYRLHDTNVAGLSTISRGEKFAARVHAAGFPLEQAGLVAEAVTRLRRAGLSPSRALLDGECYLMARSQLPSRRGARIATIGALLRNGAYAKFGGGTRTAIIDLAVSSHRKERRTTRMDTWGPRQPE